MNLYLVQHANAAPKQVDPERAITEQGRQDVQKVAAFVKPLRLSVDFLWHSTKKRSEQSAEILAGAVRTKKAKTPRDGLAPNDDASSLKNELDAMEQDVMIVGHLPFLSNLASLLLTGSESANMVAFKQGGVVSLSCLEDNKWQIDWMVTPEILF